jgi:hypothetical protein
MIMKRLTYIIFGVALLWSHGVCAQTVPGCKLKDSRIEKDIAKVAQRLQGQEYCQFRVYSSIDDVDGDKKDDFIVIFTVEGVHRSMNHFLQFILIYVSAGSMKSPLNIQVGERGSRSADQITRVEKNRITVEDSIWREGDALCCPSGKGQSVYEIKDGKIVKTLEDGG